MIPSGIVRAFLFGIFENIIFYDSLLKEKGKHASAFLTVSIVNEMYGALPFSIACCLVFKETGSCGNIEKNRNNLKEVHYGYCWRKSTGFHPPF